MCWKMSEWPCHTCICFKQGFHSSCTLPPGPPGSGWTNTELATAPSAWPVPFSSSAQDSESTDSSCVPFLTASHVERASTQFSTGCPKPRTAHTAHIEVYAARLNTSFPQRQPNPDSDMFPVKECLIPNFALKPWYVCPDHTQVEGTINKNVHLCQ